MVFPTTSRSVVTRLLATLIVLLVISPYTEPFATIHGTDTTRAGAIDVDGTAKSKDGTHDGLACPPMMTGVANVVLDSNRPVASTMAMDSRDRTPVILRQ
jgi:hypothetical protein